MYGQRSPAEVRDALPAERWSPSQRGAKASVDFRRGVRLFPNPFRLSKDGLKLLSYFV